MSRYAATREGEKPLHPGSHVGVRSTVLANRLTIAGDSWAQHRRALLVDQLRSRTLRAYREARQASFDQPSHQWMKPPGRPRFRWTSRAGLDEFGGGTLYELSCVVYPEGVLP